LKIKSRTSFGGVPVGHEFNLSEVEYIYVKHPDGSGWNYYQGDFDVVIDVKKEQERSSTKFRDLFGQDIRLIEFK
jgi:hypothetical protein